jgi:hypothetical protein
MAFDQVHHQLSPIEAVLMGFGLCRRQIKTDRRKSKNDKKYRIISNTKNISRIKEIVHFKHA